MHNLYLEVTSLDQRTLTKFGLTEEIMMEHAAMALRENIRKRFSRDASVLIVCGSGNNGADGLALGRLLLGDYDVTVHLPFGASSPLAQLQRERLERLGIKSSPIEEGYDVIVDAMFGSGLSRPLGPTAAEVIERVNAMDGFKIACDVPSGLSRSGTLDPHTFRADLTVTMGAMKRGLFSDAAKELAGEITSCDLGVPRSFYETPSAWQLLEESDLNLPLRTHASAHKGHYGHLCVICGEKTGAAVIAGSAALRFGAGLVSLISNENVQLPYELMQSHSLPSTTTAIAVGMGLGSEFDDEELAQLLENELPMVLDADILTHPILARLLKRQQIVLTPHPKEFTRLLRCCEIADIDVATLQNNRFAYAEQFCTAYPNAVLVLKGSNVIIGHGENFFINPHGTVALAKGGSGDVLGGLIGALLAQGYEPLDAAIRGSLAHTVGARKWIGNNYALTPFDLIERIAHL